jgi:hypothetical protein
MGKRAPPIRTKFESHSGKSVLRDVAITVYYNRNDLKPNAAYLKVINLYSRDLAVFRIKCKSYPYDFTPQKHYFV